MAEVSPDHVAPSTALARPDLTPAQRPVASYRRRSGLTLSTIVGMALLGGIAGMALLAHALAPDGPWKSVAAPFQQPGAEHPLGTDDLGRDLLVAIFYAVRTSLVVGLAAAGLSTGIGILLGSLSGYFGGLFDDVLMRLTEFFQVMPRFFLALVAVALFEPGLVTITLVLGLTGWPLTTRLLRAQVLAVREFQYVVAAQALGAGHARILRRHILPNTIAPVITHTSLMIGQVMLTEASLAFLGLGDPNHISLGYLLGNAQPYLRHAWWMSLFPGIAIAVAVLGFNLLGEGINDARVRYRS